MKYLCLVYLEGQKLHAVPDRECQNCGDGFRERGVLLAAEALEPIETAATVRVRNGKVQVQTGGSGSWRNMQQTSDDLCNDDAADDDGSLAPGTDGTIGSLPDWLPKIVSTEEVGTTWRERGPVPGVAA